MATVSDLSGNTPTDTGSGQFLYAVIGVSGSGDNTIITAVPERKIRVYAYTLVSAGTVAARFESGAGGTALTGQMTLAVNTETSNSSDKGLFETARGDLLNLELNAAVSVDGHITYRIV